MSYDFDIMVVGAGPAGLSAALRARWLRTYKALPASVGLVDQAGLGGLANWKDVLLTGPSFKLNLKNILDDLEVFPAQVLSGPVTASRLSRSLKTLTVAGQEYTCRAVIVCTGLKSLCNERDYVGRGLLMTLKDHAYMADQLEAFCQQHQGQRLLVWGTQPASRVVEFVASISRGRLRVESFLEGESPDRDRIVRLLGQEHVSGVEYLDSQGQRATRETDHVLLDFESYMLRTTSAAAFPELARDKGFVRVDHGLRTSVERVYAAGDITGGPFCAAKAMGEGVTAGFEAYRAVQADKFGFEPSLYAFYPAQEWDIVAERTGFRLPQLTDACCPKALLPPVQLGLRLGLCGEDMALLERLDGKTTFGQLRSEGLGQRLEALVPRAVELKALAVHV